MEIIKVDNSIEIFSIEDLLSYHKQVRSKIITRLQFFKNFDSAASAYDLFRELVFCILTANASAKMALKSINTLESVIFKEDTTEKDIENKLRGVYRFPKTRANYIYRTKLFLQSTCKLNLRKIFLQYQDDKFDLRDFLTENVIGIGYKECSHFLRNIGYTGFAILDKHVISMLNLLGCQVRKPRNKREYREIEQKMIAFSLKININIDELDLLFWSYKTGEIIK
jgi:N-glycosylase/DNA lyase